VCRIVSYSNISIQIECFSRTCGHISTQIQGNIIHARNLNYSLHVCVCVCVYAGVLNYETVYHTSILLVSRIHMYLSIY
jgi:hypothetical protein